MHFLSRKFIGTCLCTLFALLSIYLLAAHYIKAYSDPIGFVGRAESMLQGVFGTERAMVYPALLACLLPLLGTVYIFLSNLPLIILLCCLVYVVTKQVARDSGGDPRLAAFLGAGLLVLYNRYFFVEVLNPFREPFAFSLMMAAIVLTLSFERKKKPLIGIAMGCCLGLAVSTRETCAIMALPIALWWLVQWAKARRIVWVHFACLAAIGLLIGLAPALLQNYLHSGNIVVPSYAADRVEHVAEQEKWDIPIPGMSLMYFDKVSKDTIEKFNEKFGVTGWSFFTLGVLVALYRRQLGVLLILLPASLLHTFFYCFYSYAKERYLFVVDITAVPIMALGLHAVIEWVIRASGRLREAPLHKLRPVAAVAMILVTAVFFARAYGDKQDRLQVWHVDELRDAIQPNLEEPYTFLGRRHHAQLLSWLLDGDMFEVTLGFRWLGRQGDMDINEALASHGAAVLERMRNGNYYIYGDRRPPLLRAWFDFHPVMSFQDLPAPLDHYGRPMKEGLYKVTPWSQQGVEREVPVPREAEAYLLKASLFRLWDYDRTYCRLMCGDDILLDRIPNDAFFVPIPASYVTKGTVRLRVESDGPLPQDPFFELIAQGDELYLPFGSGHAIWYYDQIDPTLLMRRHGKEDGFVFYDEGFVKLPRYGGADDRVFADLRIEYIQEDAYLRGLHHIELSNDHDRIRMPLPPRRQTRMVTVELGNGGNELVYQTVFFRTDLPSLDEQKKLADQHLVMDAHGVKVLSATMYTLPATPTHSLAVDFGEGKDGPYLVEGFYHPERSVGGNVRWTEPIAVMRLPLATGATDYEVIVHARNARPANTPAEPTFAVNEWSVPADRVTVWEEAGQTTYSFVLPREHVTAGDDLLRIATRAWNPMPDSNIADPRSLGVMLDRIEVKELSR